jgi:hypothetical protein
MRQAVEMKYMTGSKYRKGKVKGIGNGEDVPEVWMAGGWCVSYCSYSLSLVLLYLWLV